jgi:hypothetical protein
MVALGILVFAVLAGLIALLAGMGIASLSVLVGWYHRSLRKGASTFLQHSLVAAGAATGILVLLAIAIFQVPFTLSTLFCVGIIASGAVAGWVCSVFIKTILQLLFRKLVAGK